MSNGSSQIIDRFEILSFECLLSSRLSACVYWKMAGLWKYQKPTDLDSSGVARVIYWGGWGGGEVKEPVKQGMKVALLVPVGKIIRSAKICANVKRQYFISFGVHLFAPRLRFYATFCMKNSSEM